MATVTTLPFRPDGWTVDDLDELPDDGNRYELLDGALLVSPPPELMHQYVGFRLAALLSGQLPPDLAVVTAPGVYYDSRTYRIPDVVVFRRSALSRPRPHLRPADVVIAVELMSPGNERTDRLKPAEYAAAGVPHFWRVELEAPVVVTHTLDGAVYRETGRFSGVVELAEPAPLRVRVADLLP